MLLCRTELMAPSHFRKRTAPLSRRVGRLPGGGSPQRLSKSESCPSLSDYTVRTDMETLGEPSTRRSAPPAHRLIHVLNYDDLATARSQSFALEGPLTIGRGTSELLRRAGGRIESADGWLSTDHADVSVDGERWKIEDRGSRNGVWVNGAKVKQHALSDGDLVELGHGLWCYRVAPSDRVETLEARRGGFKLGPTRTWSAAVAAVVADVERIAPSVQPVLVIAETGAGKEHLARQVHALSGRRGAFVPVDCGAVPETLFESTFFGHRKGAFTGAQENRDGELVRADRGTLFLDELGNLGAASQAKLLRVLEDGLVRALGAANAVKVDVRIVAATNRELFGDEDAIRSDLLRRLAGYVARLPPLRQRREDLGELTAFLLAEGGVKRASITSAAARTLFGGPFTGNVRELKTTLVTASLLAGSEPIDVQHLPAPAPQSSSGDELEPGGKRTSAPTAEELTAVLTATKGNVVHAAKQLGTHARQVYRWLEKRGLDPERFRPADD